MLSINDSNHSERLDNCHLRSACERTVASWYYNDKLDSVVSVHGVLAVRRATKTFGPFTTQPLDAQYSTSY